ncbi:MAG TPA: sugar porter family MFS transporter [Rhabdochlamydiaceae bacterium]|nr:sugar porter family MFS transporter [Rhabdochlamydiaceae bacterium]
MAKEQFTPFALFVVMLVILGSFLFGYNLAVISGALIFLVPTFSLTVMQQGFLVSIILMGAFAGAFFGGMLADRFGRKNTLIFTSLIFIVGAVSAATATSLEALVVGRVVTGIAVGIISLVAPLYLSEISPPHYRGAVVSMHQLLVTVGILSAYVVNYLFAIEGDWRWMFGLAAVPALIQFCGLFFIPETPEWLLAHDKNPKALLALGRLRKDHAWQNHLIEMKQSASTNKRVGWKAFFKPSILWLLFLGVMLNIFQQITGINTVIFYAPKIFLETNISSGTGAILATIGIGIINVIVTIFSVLYIDKKGRRWFLKIGLIGMAFSLAVLSLAFFTQIEIIDEIAIVSLMTYVAAFAIGLGPVPVLLLSEIYPLQIRGRAMSIAMFANWLFSYFVSLTFLDLVKGIGVGGTFAVYGALCIICLWFVWRFIPETKGKSLEEIEKALTY